MQNNFKELDEVDKIKTKFTDSLKNFYKKYNKFILFLLIFSCVCFIYNSNNQLINYILNKGTEFEYSIGKYQEIDKKELGEKLIKTGNKFLLLDTSEPEKLTFDSDNKEVQKVLKIALALKLNEKNKKIADELSEFIFDKYNAKLINVKAYKDKYSSPYAAFIKFLTVLFLSLIIQYGILYFFSDDKKINEKLKENIKNFFKKQKESLSNLYKNTKEKGAVYLLKKIIFDEVDDDKEANYTKEIITTILFVLICVILIRYFIGELRWIPSGSMRPTILEHDRVFVEKLNFPKKEIKRGDILVFYPPEVQLSNSPLAILARMSGIMCKDIAFIKRTIGLPGEKFEVKYDNETNEFRVYINDMPLNEPYIISRHDWTVCNKQMFCGPFIIPKGHYFMMGDNRGNSQDSRFWGFLDENRIIGRANFMFFPIKRINLLRDKYFELSKQKINGKTEKEIFITDRY